jgi:hypothetical protein
MRDRPRMDHDLPGAGPSRIWLADLAAMRPVPGLTLIPARGSRSGHPSALVHYLRRNRTTSTMITMITMAPKPINMGVLLS